MSWATRTFPCPQHGEQPIRGMGAEQITLRCGAVGSDGQYAHEGPEPIPSDQWTTELVKEAVEGINGPFVEGDYEFDETSGEKAAAYLNANEYDVREYHTSGDYASDAAFVYDVIMWTSRL